MENLCTSWCSVVQTVGLPIIRSYDYRVRMPQALKRTYNLKSSRPLKKRRVFRLRKRPIIRRRYRRRNPYRPEVKCLTLQETEKLVNTLTQFSSSVYKVVNAIDQGDGDTNRDGNVAVGKGIYIRGSLHNNVAYTIFVRLLVFELPDDNTLSDIATSGNELFRGNVPETLSGIKTMYYPMNKAKFKKIWYDKVIKLGGFQSAANGTDTRFFKIFRKFSTRLRWNSSSVSQSPSNGALYFMYWCAQGDEDVTTGANIELSYLSSYYFQDV